MAIRVFNPNGFHVEIASLAAAAALSWPGDLSVAIDSAVSLSGDLTWPDDRLLDLRPGGLINLAGYTITFESEPRLGRYQAFSGSGSVVFPSGTIPFPEWWGAAGDGATNDTAAFTALEASVTGQTVDLGGRTFLVDAQVTGNTYINGYFKRTADAHIFKAGRNPSHDNRGAEITVKNRAARFGTEPGIDRAIIVLGDSISHGAYAGDLYQNGWVNILKRMMNVETRNRGYGFAPLGTLGSGATLSKEVHDITVSGGGWNFYHSTVEGGTDIIQGYAYEGTSAGTYIEAVVPTFQQYVRVWFMYQPGGGNFTVTINGVAQPQQTTDLSYRAGWSNLYQMLDDGSGKCTIRVTIDSGPTIICGFGYEKPVTTSPATAGNVVQNFSQSGRRLYMATEGMIESACKGSMLILALGFNDHLDCDSDADYNAAFQQRIDWIIEYCLQYNTTLVVADFCWWATPDNLARKGLRRAAMEARGIYVPLPDYVTRDQLLKTEFYNPSYPTDGTDLLVTNLQMWVDGAHPNVYGQKWIAETIAKAMGLSCTSKEQALAHYDWAWPIQFDAASNFKNRFTAMPYLSFVRRNGSDLLFSLHFITKSGANISVGSAQVLSKALTAALSRQFVAYSTAQVTQQPIMLAGDGTVHVAVSMTLDCIISIRCVTASGTYVDGTFRAPFDHYN